MFAQPTMDDFLRRLDWHLEKAVGLSERSQNAITARHAAQGRLRSGATIKAVYESAHVEFAKGVEAALGELKRIALKTALDRDQMRRLTEERLRAFVERCKAATKPEMLRSFGPGGPIQGGLGKVGG